MVEYTQEMGKEFFYDFDNQTLWNRTGAVTQAVLDAYISRGMNLDGPVDALRQSFAGPDHPASFVARIEAGRQGFLDLATIQLSIIDAHLDADPENIRLAFEDFGQGTLFDDRSPRPPTRYIHMMDGTPQPPNPWVGYHRWHAFVQAASLLGADSDRWYFVNKCFALAWAIQSETQPALDNPNNPPMPEERLSVLRDAWMNASVDVLNWAFVNHAGHAPAPEDVIAMSAAPLAAILEPQTNYGMVQQILDDATGTGNPNHGGNGRFWMLSLPDFKVLPPIYGVTLIETEGENRGSRSGLIKALKGETPFGPGGMPQMPMNGTPVSPENIQLIQDWIDAGCPE